MNNYSIYSNDSNIQQQRQKKRRRDALNGEISSQFHNERSEQNLGAGLIGNTTLESLVIKPSRASFDQLPYDEEEDSTDWAMNRCIGCQFVSAAQPSATEEDKDCWAKMHDIILANHNCRCSDGELVNLVYDYYEKEIRAWQDFGHWSKKMIHAHIYIHMADPDIQTAGLAQLLYAQIESLRNCCWQKNTETGEMTPNAVNIKLLNELIAKHQTLVAARRKQAK